MSFLNDRKSSRVDCARDRASSRTAHASVGVRASIAALAASFLISAPASAVVLIDSFKDTDAVWPVAADQLIVPVDVSEFGLVGVIGGMVNGSRFTRTVLEAGIPGLDEVRTLIDPVALGGVLDFDSTVEADGFLQLVYDGSGQLSADLSGEQLIAVELAAYDAPGGADMPVTVELTSGGFTAALTLPASGGPQSLQFAFADFEDIGLIDLSDISEISVAFDPGAGADFRISGFLATPAPGALGLFLIVGAGSRRRRRG